MVFPPNKKGSLHSQKASKRIEGRGYPNPICLLLQLIREVFRLLLNSRGLAQFSFQERKGRVLGLYVTRPGIENLLNADKVYLEPRNKIHYKWNLKQFKPR